MKKNYSFFFFLSLVVCQLNVQAQKYAAAELEYDYNLVYKRDVTDSSLLKFLKPYRDSMTKVMNTVIGFSNVTLYNKQPECPLGNFMADAMKQMGEKKFNRKIDVALVNYSASRYIPKGEITLQNAYDLMPYDNLIILQELKGSVLKNFLDYTALKGSWSVSGVKMKIRDRRTDSIYINGNLIDDNATYMVANTDYVIKGGADNFILLKNIPQINVGYLFRDALTEYIQQFTKQGKPVSAAIEGRVVNVE